MIDQVEVLEGGLLGGELAAGVDGAAEPGVQRLDPLVVQITGLISREGQERHELGPGVLPQPHDRRVRSSQAPLNSASASSAAASSAAV